MSLTSQIGRVALAPLIEEEKKSIRGENVVALLASAGEQNRSGGCWIGGMAGLPGVDEPNAAVNTRPACG